MRMLPLRGVIELCQSSCDNFCLANIKLSTCESLAALPLHELL